MAYKYVVLHRFGPYKKGDQITDEAKIAMLSEHQKKRCVRVAVPDQPARAESTKEPAAPIGAGK